MNRYALILFVLGTTTLANAQGFFGGMNLYMFNDQFANPALAVAREYGTSLTSQANHSFIYGEMPSFKASLVRQSHSLEQSLFHGRGGVQMQWNQFEENQIIRNTIASLGYSHGVRIGKKLILRAGLQYNFRSINYTFNWPLSFYGDPNFPSGPDIVSYYDAGLSIHHKYVYVAGGFHQLLVHEKGPDEPNISFRWGVFTTEIGGRIPLSDGAKKIGDWSLQPFAKLYTNGPNQGYVFGSFLNYGPFQAGCFYSDITNLYASIGVNLKYMRFHYAFQVPNNRPVSSYSSVKLHEFALRLILPSHDKSRDFMGNKYRGF